MASDKIELARRLYVEDGRSLSELAISFDIAMFVLNNACVQNNWDAQRQDFLSRVQAIDPNDTLSQHKEKLRQQFLYLDTLRVRLTTSGLEANEKRQLKDEIEMAKNLAEALAITIELDRKVHGVKNSAPSAADNAGEVHGVEYVVKLPAAAKSIQAK